MILDNLHIDDFQSVYITIGCIEMFLILIFIEKLKNSINKKLMEYQDCHHKIVYNIYIIVKNKPPNLIDIYS